MIYARDTALIATPVGPIHIVIPRRPVLTNSKARDNYSVGGGTVTKRWLLNLETSHGAQT